MTEFRFCVLVEADSVSDRRTRSSRSWNVMQAIPEGPMSADVRPVFDDLQNSVVGLFLKLRKVKRGVYEPIAGAVRQLSASGPYFFRHRLFLLS